jgi:outer membrane protein assembly factor BamB
MVLSDSLYGATADLDGDGYDSALVWSQDDFVIYACEGIEPVFPDEEPAFVAHELYYDIDLESDIDTIWVEDISGDDRDEIVVSTDDNFLMLLNGTTGEVIWNVTMDERIREVRFGQFTGSADLDLAVLCGTGTSSVAILDGEDGSEVTRIVPTEPKHVIRDCEAGEFNAGHSGDEIVVLFEKTSVPTKGYLAWYDRGGNHLYTSSFNATSTGNHLTVGNYLGGATLDAAFGGYDNFLRVYNGSSGVYIWGFTNGRSIYDLISGDFDGDVYEDLAFRDSFDDVTMVSGATRTSVYTIIIPTGDFRGFYAADLYNNDSIDELIINWREIGIRGFDYIGNEVWFYEMPLKIKPKAMFGDMDRDGHTDLVVTNHDYVTAVSGATLDVIWHHRSNDSIYAPAVGIFYEEGSAPDVAMAHYSKLLVVSGSWPAPIPPPPAALPALLSMSFAEMVLVAAATGLPLSALILFGFVCMRRRRRKGE